MPDTYRKHATHVGIIIIITTLLFELEGDQRHKVGSSSLQCTDGETEAQRGKGP